MLAAGHRIPVKTAGRAFHALSSQSSNFWRGKHFSV
jgi:hypothetical protein